MNPERLKQVEEIYHAALAISPEKRESFFKEFCGADENLRREVESLLTFENTFDSFIDAPPESLAAEIFAVRAKRTSLVGSEIGHYKIKELLGAGGMGEVYVAKDTKLGRPVALKILPSKFAEDKDRMRRFVREAKSASALNHPNIITIYEIGQFNGTHFISTEFIDGVTLKEYAKTDSLNFKSALEIAIQIASALDEAHAAGIVHRDIKPDNVMIRANGLVKILDFGIAKLSGSNGQPNLDAEAATAIKSETSPGMIIGTANYMSPEQAKGKEIDARSDIFSFGIVLYEMLTGKKAFDGETPLDAISSILKDEPKPIRGLLPEIPQEIERIINKTLRKDRGERYQTARDLLTDLKDAKQRLEFQHKPGEITSPTHEEPKTQLLSAPTGDVQHPTSSAEFITQEFKKNKRGFAFAFVMLLSAVIGLGYLYSFNRAANSKQIESIAVMPFVNESGNSEVEYLSDGMTETLISSLSKLSNLNVKARSSVFRYKGKELDFQKIAKELNAQAILTGRVVQQGEQLKLGLELVDATTENVLWSEQYNRKQTDLVSLQSEIARDVSNKLRMKLSGADEQRLANNYTANPEAYQLYLRGRFYWNKRTAEDLKRAIEQFKAAADLDPNYALAFVGLADSYLLLEQYTGTPPSETLPQARSYAERAVQIDGQLAEAHTSLAFVNYMLWQWADSEKEFKRAIELNPNYPTARHWYYIYLRDMGRFDEALAEIKHAQELDPLSLVINVSLTRAYLLKGDVDTCIEQTKKLIELHPNYAPNHGFLGLAYIKQGRYTEALAEMQKAIELQRSSDSLAFLAYANAISGKHLEANAIIRELEERYAKREALGRDISAVYAGLGKNDEAFAWLDKDFQVRSGDLSSITWHPTFDSLRKDPRYADLLRRMNLPR